ncbi:protein O-mannosyl-transferase Tmtc3-like [Uloborus diversus]|uniref:protein O-mannosyl-transferase Tmtc3-like n=1 Tax=Uloborus diversus TaxID=327109 RepID=UPI002409935C|nr:protein O-mannosyl-transferase Tmtc3-like [Uloborus diversus]
MCRQVPKRIVALSSRKPPDDDEVKGYAWRNFLIATIACICYLNSLSCGLVFDDQPAIRDNMDVRPSTPLFKLLYNDFWGTPLQREDSHKSYRPLCVMTFRINYWLHELNPWGYHLANTVLHVVVCLLYHRFCLDFLPKTSSLVAALLFAVHPIHTEAVTGIVGRAELLSSIFFLMALRIYIRCVHRGGAKDYKSLIQCLGFIACAMLSKEQGITVVAICVTYEVLLVQQRTPPPHLTERSPRGRIKGPTPTWRKDLVLRLLVMTLGTALLLAARMKWMGSRLPVFNKFDNPAAATNWPTKHLTHNYLVALNAWLLLFPSDLCCDWTMGTVPLVTSVRDHRVIATIIFYAAIVVVIWKSYYSNFQSFKKMILGLSLCAFPFLPASNLFYYVGFVIAERVLYIPSMGFCFIVAQGWHNLCLMHKKKKVFLYCCLVILLCLNAVKTIRRNFDWQSEETLFRAGLQMTTANAKLYNNLGHVMESRSHHTDALQLFLQAAAVQPDDLGSHLNVGRMYNVLGMSEDAEKAFRIAKNLLPKVRPGQSYQAHIAPRHMDLFLNLGSLLSKNRSRLEEAQELYKEAISMKKDYVDAYMQRAEVLLKLNRSEEAHNMYKEALKHDRMNPDIFYNMGVLLLEQGKAVQALARFDQALQLDPEHEKSLLNYAILTQDTGDSSLRRVAYERLQVLLDKGRQPERTYFNMGMLAMQDGDVMTAETYFRKALQLRSDFDAALFNLGLILYQGGRPLEAVPYLRRLGSFHLKGLVLLGDIYFNHLRNFTAAQQCYESILKQDPNHVPALHNLCVTYFQLDQLVDAKSCLEKAVELAPAETHIQQHLHLVQERLKQSDVKALQRTPKSDFCSNSSADCGLRFHGKLSKNQRSFNRSNEVLKDNNLKSKTV